MKAQESCGSFLKEVDDAVPLVTRMAHPVVSIVWHSGEEGTALENHRGIGTTVYRGQDRKEVNRVGQDGKTEYITVEDQSVLSDVEAGIAEVLIFSTIEEPRSDQGLSAQCISLIIRSGSQVKMPVKMMSLANTVRRPKNVGVLF